MTTPLQFFNYQQGILTSEQVSLPDMATHYGTPTYLYSSEGFLEPLRQLHAGLKKLDFLVCFALKSNSNLAVLRLLSDSGAGMDLVTGGELHRASRAKIPADRIVFSGVGKSREEMIAALEYDEKGIFSFNVESLPELNLLNEVALGINRRARVAFRYNPDVNAKTHPYISTGLKKNKFGMDKAEIMEIVTHLDQFKGIDLRGLSIHIGSQLLSLSPLDDAFTRLRNLIKEINPLLSSPLSFVDLGGGVGISYNEEKAPLLKKYCALIHKHFDRSNLKILIEPGRTLSGNSGVLLTKILFRKRRKLKDFLIVDAGMNDLIRPALYGSYHHVVPLKKPKSRGKLRKFDLVGPVCESADCFASDRLLPEDLQEGDLLAILSAGAYGFSMSSNYNSRPRPAEVLIQQGRHRIIRDRESYDDLLRGERE